MVVVVQCSLNTVEISSMNFKIAMEIVSLLRIEKAM